MRQVNRDELIHLIASGMNGWSVSLRKLLSHHDANERLKGRVIAAGIIANKFQRLEILSNAPAPAPFRYPALGIEGYDRDDSNNVPAPNPWATVGEG